MKVLVNSLALPSCRQGGSGFCTAALIDGLSRAEDIECVTLASQTVAAELEELAPAAEVAIAPSHTQSAPAKVLNQAVAARKPWALDLGFAGPAPVADLVHWPIAFMNGPTAERKGPWVLSIHDVQHEFFPEFFSRRDRLLRRLRWRPSAQAADHIITISEFSRRTICERFDLPREKVSTVPLAARNTLVADPGGIELPAGLGKDEEPWVVYPASPLPAKNHERLLEGLALHRERSGNDLHLVLIGPTQHSWAAVEGAITRLGLEQRVLRLGHVSEEMLSSLYARSTGLIFPSLFEGFGMPVVEAMGAGCPIAVSDAGSLPEVTAGVGRSFSPYAVEEIADSLGWLVGLDQAERSRQVAAGLKKAAEFSVERMVDETRAVYEGLL
ncbi:MAG TPA: glycosyltransferase family 1 protein [Solirubrobacterales bacterium]|nr:glycosyltransferase family 1 protein [Solirubrobacterales bacterium]